MLNQTRGPDDVFNHILRELFDQHSLHWGRGQNVPRLTLKPEVREYQIWHVGCCSLEIFW